MRVCRLDASDDASGGGNLSLQGSRVFDKELSNRNAEPLLLAHLTLKSLRLLSAPCAGAEDAESEHGVRRAVLRFAQVAQCAQRVQSEDGASGSVWCIRQVHLEALCSLLAVQAHLLPCFGSRAADELASCARQFSEAGRICLGLQPLHPVLARTLLAAAEDLRDAEQTSGRRDAAAPQAGVQDANGLENVLLNLRVVVDGIEGDEHAAVLYLAQ